MKMSTRNSFLLVFAVTVLAVVSMTNSSWGQTVIEQWKEASIPAPPEVKAVKAEAKKTAVLLLDFNRGSCNLQRRIRCGEALPKLRKLLDAARSKGVLVVFKTQSTATAKDIPDEIAPLGTERVFSSSTNKYLNVFSSPDILKFLKDGGIESVVLTGTSPNSTVQFAVGGAADAGFKAIVPVDGMPADTIYQEQFTVWNVGNGAVLRENSTLTKLEMIEFF
jgi:nicotinamidase-related amidase